VSCHAAELHKKKSSSSKVNCNTYCNGTDDRTIAHSKKGTSLPKENTPDKCGLWVQGSTAVRGILTQHTSKRSCSWSSTRVAAWTVTSLPASRLHWALLSRICALAGSTTATNLRP
jgi:hypothetical protein